MKRAGAQPWGRRRLRPCQPQRGGPNKKAKSMAQSLANVLVHIVYSTRHHKCISFQDEFRELWRRHRIALDQRYAWD